MTPIVSPWPLGIAIGLLMEIPMVNWPQEGNHTRLKPFDEERFEYAITEGRT